MLLIKSRYPAYTLGLRLDSSRSLLFAKLPIKQPNQIDINTLIKPNRLLINWLLPEG